mgnify:CR=1 FL=1
MLKKRILTAILLIPLLVAALFYLPTLWIAVLFGIFVAAAAWEWAALAGISELPGRLVFMLILLAFGAIGVLGVLNLPSFIWPLLVVPALWWLWMLVELFVRKDVHRGMFASAPSRIAGGFLVLIPVWVAAVYLHATDMNHPRTILFLFVLVWTADTAAYFAGSFFGKTKLAPQISPGKTREGVAGGLIAVVLLAWVCGTMLWKYEGVKLMVWIGLSAVTALFSVVGDLAESKLKRIAGVKDSGSLLPGHGGVLDRIDALTAAAPMFVLGWILFLKWTA